MISTTFVKLSTYIRQVWFLSSRRVVIGPRGQKKYRAIKYRGSQKSLPVRIARLWNIKNEEIQVVYKIVLECLNGNHMSENTTNNSIALLLKKKKKNSVAVSVLQVLKILSIPTVEVLQRGQSSAAPFHKRSLHTKRESDKKRTRAAAAPLLPSASPFAWRAKPFLTSPASVCPVQIHKSFLFYFF